MTVTLSSSGEDVGPRGEALQAAAAGSGVWRIERGLDGDNDWVVAPIPADLRTVTG